MRLKLTSEDIKKICDRIEIPEEKRNASLDKIPDYAYKKAVVSYLKSIEYNLDQGIGLVLHGPYSTGKSCIAAICLKYAMWYGTVGYWVRSQELTGAKIENQMFDATTTVYERCMQVPLLVIDELEIRKKAEFSSLLIDEIVRTRVDEKLATILTMNMALPDLENIYPSLSAILDEVGPHIRVTGKDFRKNELMTEKEGYDRNKDGTSKIW